MISFFYFFRLMDDANNCASSWRNRRTVTKHFSQQVAGTSVAGFKTEKTEGNGVGIRVKEERNAALRPCRNFYAALFFVRDSRRRIAMWTNKNGSRSMRVRLGLCSAMSRFFRPHREVELCSIFWLSSPPELAFLEQSFFSNGEKNTVL